MCNAIIRIDKETVGELVMLVEGEARDSIDQETNCPTLTFENVGAITTVIFLQPTLYMYIHELLVDKDEYPYRWHVKQGLYESMDSNFLKRIQNNWQSSNYFENDRHFIYWDHQYLTHIVAPRIDLTREDKDSAL